MKNKIRPEIEHLKIGILGITSFPHKLGAENSKTLLITKALAMQSDMVYAINRRSYLSENKNASGHILPNLLYTTCTNSTVRSNNFFTRNLKKFKSFWNEIYLIKRFNLDVAIIITRKFSLILKYKLLSKIFSFKIVLTYVELASKIKERQNYRFIFNDFLFEKYAFYLIDGLLPISEFLKDFALKRNRKLQLLKLPVIVDIEMISKIQPKESSFDFFLFCGHAAYFDIINLIISQYELLKNNKIHLILILHGPDKFMEAVRKRIDNTNVKEKIIIKNKLSYFDLIGYFKRAEALLIPLMNTFTDIARFPHKVGEYLACGRPIITTDVGEMNFYFKNGENALIASIENPDEIFMKMNFVLENSDAALKIGMNGAKTCGEFFDLGKNGEMMHDFFRILLRKK
jgi:glycosyltransferase involved in cell wall biosynthesis